MPPKKSGKLNHQKAESITVRLNPKMKYGLDLLARKHHRNLSSVVEWAINKALEHPEGGLWRDDLSDSHPVRPLLDVTWDAYPSTRLIRLAVYKPELLSFSEELLWKFIQTNNNLWIDKPWNLAEDLEKSRSNFSRQDSVWSAILAGLNFELLRTVWPDCLRYMDDEISEAELTKIINNLAPPSEPVITF